MIKKETVSYKLLMALVFVGGFAFFTACNKDDDDNQPDNEQELITTIQLTFVDNNNVASVFTASDPDGAGGQAPAIETIVLESDADYRMSVAFLDESNPADIKNITEEVEAESPEHLVCFNGTGFTELPMATDDDSNGDPLGLVSEMTTGPAGMGTLTITLKHEPVKTASAPCTTGETDAEVTFPVLFQ